MAGGCWERMRRALRTIFFMVAMLASLLVQCLPVLIAVGDVLVPCVLISRFTTCVVGCYGFRDHLRRYSFSSSLLDIPIVSLLRSIFILCVYTLCDGPALSDGPYLGSVTICSISSILLLSVKVCVFSVNSQVEAEGPNSFSRHILHMKKSWGMPILFLSSVVFALGHMVIAYRTSCKARRKLLFHRVDPETVLSCKSLLSAYQKIPRSPIPTSKTSKSDSDERMKPYNGLATEGTLPIRLLADIDSLFTTCLGVTVHYKISMPCPSPRFLSSTNFSEPSASCIPQLGVGRIKLDRTLTALPKTQHLLHRSYSNQFHSSLYDPLLDNFPSDVPVNEIPPLSLDDVDDKDATNNLSPSIPSQDLEANGQCGVVLVHGFGGGVFSWRHVMGTLAHKVGCTVAAFDRPGWGLTPRLKKKDWEEKQSPNPYKLETQVDLLLAFCSDMGFSSVVLVGHDDGGLLALKAAEKVQRRESSINIAIEAVVLLSVDLSRDVVPAFARILLRTSLGKKHLVRPLLRTEITQVVNRRAWYDATKLTTEVLKLYKIPLCVEGWDEALHEINKLSCETILSPKSVELLLNAIQSLPVLVVSGAEDALVSLQSAQTMASKFPNSRLVTISGCGHLPHEECPQATLAAISPFISRILCDSEMQ